MESLQCMRLEDRLEAVPVATGRDSIDHSLLLGIWINTNNQTRGITRVVVQSQNGELTVEVFGATSEGATDWGEAKADVVYASSVRSHEAMAFSASYDFGYLEVYLQANLSLGLLVVAGLNTFKDGSGRANYFSREFFYNSEQRTEPGAEFKASRAESLKPMRDEERVAVGAGRARSGAIDASPFLGQWLTTNRATRGLVRIEVSPHSAGLAVQTSAACIPDPCDWGVASGALFSESPGSDKGLAFSALYDFEFMETRLQAKVKKGVLVVAVFNRFKDVSGRSNYFSREFFYGA